ncbi:MAG: C-GCAxxG-C-C family protein [Desulfobacteraceae bacterium]|nr:C-GCAxxG-C-C family protein [Desulfobacteraceae bacterium]
MTIETVRMIELAQQGFHCSQILLMLGLEAQGKSNPDVIRVMNSLAGGLGFSGEICGALTGGACLLGLYAGRGGPEEEEDPKLNLMISELIEWFSAEFGTLYGGIRCSAILDDNPGNRTARCPVLVVGVFERVKELLKENGYDFTQARP